MVGADDLTRAVARLTLHHSGCSVATDVVKGSEHTIPSPDHKDSLPCEIRCEIVARLGNVARVANHQPVAPEDALFFELKKFGVVVDPGGEGLKRSRVRGRSALGYGGRAVAGKFGRKDAGQKSPAGRPSAFKIESPLVAELRLGQRRQQVMECAAQGLGLEMRVSAGFGDGREGHHPLLLEFGLARGTHPHVVLSGSGLAPEGRPHRNPVGVTEFGVEGRFDHRLETGHRVVRVGEHRVALAEHVLAIHVLESRQKQGILAAKIEIDDARGEPGPAGHPGHGGPGEPVLGNAPDGGVDQFLAAARVPGRRRRLGLGPGNNLGRI